MWQCVSKENIDTFSLLVLVYSWNLYKFVFCQKAEKMCFGKAGHWPRLYIFYSSTNLWWGKHANALLFVSNSSLCFCIIFDHEMVGGTFYAHEVLIHIHQVQLLLEWFKPKEMVQCAQKFCLKNNVCCVTWHSTA